MKQTIGISKGLTLCADQYDRNLSGIPVVGHFIEVVRNRIIADLVIKAEHENNSIHPGRELKQNRKNLANTKTRPKSNLIQYKLSHVLIPT